MIFSSTYKRSSVSYQQQSKMFAIPLNIQRPVQNNAIVVEQTLPPPVKLKWGKPIWTFFHTMAQKMRGEYFHLIISDFMRIITSICSVLPCPVCSKHAVEYIRSVNVNNIRTKEQLIDFFHAFHNSVNKRKGYPFFPRESVVAEYAGKNTYYVIHEFMYHFEDKQRTTKIIVDDFLRRRIVPQVKTWINANIQYFES
jgi:hypothetical protein